MGRTRYGIACVRRDRGDPEVLLIQRRDSIGFLELVRGRFDACDASYVRRLLADTTAVERHRMRTLPFEALWRRANSWGDASWTAANVTKFGSLVSSDAFRDPPDPRPESQWEFPTGGPRYREAPVACALREFEEETGFDRAHLRVLASPLVHAFRGLDGKHYRHMVYPAIAETAAAEAYVGVPNHEVGAFAWSAVPRDARHKMPDVPDAMWEQLVSVVGDAAKNNDDVALSPPSTHPIARRDVDIGGSRWTMV